MNRYPYYFSGRAPVSYVRLLHAVPDAPAVDVYANDSLVAAGLSYRSFTEYMRLIPGIYRVTVYRAGTKANPLADAAFDLPAGSIYTLAAVGRLSEITLFPVNDPLLPTNPSMANLRFVHLAPDAPAVDVVLPNLTMLFKNIGYRQISDYTPVRPGIYIFELRPAGTNEILLYVPNIRLLPNRNYTIYSVGLINGRPPLQVLIPLDGSSYLKPV